MYNISYLLDKEILKHQKKIYAIELKYFLNFVPLIDLDKYNLVKKKITNYKLITNILYSNPEFYQDLKEIQIDFTRDSNELSCLEIIWITQHYEFIEEIKSIQNDIIQLIKFAKKYQLISFIQYKYIKKILPKINKIFYYDKSMEYFYSPEQNILFFLTKDEIELFYNILDVVFGAIDIISSKLNINNNLCDITKISTNHKYINLIKKNKSNFENK
jgi:hypothetical protein